MSINASKTKNKKGGLPEPMEAGSYPARLVVVADIGLQPQRAFDGKDKEPAYEVLTTYEFADEFMLDEEGNEDKTKPRWISETFALYDLTSTKAKSTARYISLDPEMKYKGDWSKLGGTPCVVTIVKNPGKGKNAGKVFNNIVSVAAMRPKDALRLPELVNEIVMFDMDSGDVDTFNKLPEWVRKKITSALNFPGSLLERNLGDDYEATEDDDGADELDDEVPF